MALVMPIFEWFAKASFRTTATKCVTLAIRRYVIYTRQTSSQFRMAIATCTKRIFIYKASQYASVLSSDIVLGMGRRFIFNISCRHHRYKA
ncbi:hypothetical protein SLE2022_312120 [Rubroshorea leprosula]